VVVRIIDTLVKINIILVLSKNPIAVSNYAAFKGIIVNKNKEQIKQNRIK